jgi:hypothetical protein
MLVLWLRRAIRADPILYTQSCDKLSFDHQSLGDPLRQLRLPGQSQCHEGSRRESRDRH